MLTLGISTSSSHFSVVFGEDNFVLFNSENLELSYFKTIEILVAKGLAYINREVREITNIIVDNGPGGTSSVRTGVAFANGLGYSLGINVCPVSAFEILGFDIYSNSQIPVLLTTKSIKGNAFLGYFNSNKLHSISYGKVDNILQNIINVNVEFIATGYYKDIIKDLSHRNIINVSDQQYGDIELLIKHEQLFTSRALRFPNFVIPITEKTLSHA
ncbi:MAG: hypothetical protein WCP85_09460 [Mariniphaga sp.]